ncbi:DMT family transporter [Marinomonas spartinae]|uniref:DMT family transporter n=1 Tax=Marinomonas spartinae TaxID=1792290 RepID=UPI0018F1AFED|nr:DMT family transporter [Marinomonas spartinae]MBJ7554982.1 DMT family transporter [Marinomonas spartinae]
MNALLLLLLWAWLMASSFIVSGHMVQYASPLATSAVRFLLSLLMMLPALMVSWHRSGLNILDQFHALFQSKRRLLHYLMISGALVGFFVGLFTSLEFTTPLHTSVLYTLIPLMGVLIAFVWLRELPSWWRVLGFVLGSMGAMIVLLATHSSGTFGWNKGDSLFLGACLLLAFHVVSVQKWGHTLGALPGAFMIMLFGTVWLLPIALIWGNIEQVQWLSFGFWSTILYLTIFTTLLTFVLQQRLVTTVGASRLLAFSYTVPIWVAVYTAFSQARWSDLFDFGFVTGVSIVLLALILIRDKRGVGVIAAKQV